MESNDAVCCHLVEHDADCRPGKGVSNRAALSADPVDKRALKTTSGLTAAYRRPVDSDRWERLVESLTWGEDDLDVEMAAAVTQGETAQVGLVHRLHASTRVTVRAGATIIRGRVGLVGPESFTVRDEVAEWIVPVRSVDIVEGLDSAIAWEPRRSADRATFASMVRSVAGEAATVYLNGHAVTGVIARVGVDHLDVVDGTTKGGSVAVAFRAITCIRRPI